MNAGGSTLSNEAEATTPAAPMPPAAPGNLSGTPGVRSVTLAWTDNSNNETLFAIYRCSGSSCTPNTRGATVGANVTTFTNSGLGAHARYRYRVRAENAAGVSGWSNTVTVRTQ